MSTPRKITPDEAKDIAAELAADYYASDDLRALCQFVGLLDADPIEALEAERAAHQATAQRLRSISRHLRRQRARVPQWSATGRCRVIVDELTVTLDQIRAELRLLSRQPVTARTCEAIRCCNVALDRRFSHQERLEAKRAVVDAINSRAKGAIQ
jgi:hypothetical protein